MSRRARREFGEGCPRRLGLSLVGSLVIRLGLATFSLASVSCMCCLLCMARSHWGGAKANDLTEGPLSRSISIVDLFRNSRLILTRLKFAPLHFSPLSAVVYYTSAPVLASLSITKFRGFARAFVTHEYN